MKIIVQLTDQAAAEFTKSQNTGVFDSRLKELLARYDSTFEVMHPDIFDDALQSYFTLTAPDTESAELLVNEFRGTVGILAAYVKPEEHAP